MKHKYFEINKNEHSIRCKLYYGSTQGIAKIVVFCHGFAGHKDNGAAEKLAAKLLAKHADAAVLVFNWPCHGDDEKKTLKLSECADYLSAVVNYAKEEYRTDEIYCCATSFGGYLVLKYIAETGKPFKKNALRCPAVNMYDVLTKTIMKPEERESILGGETVSVGFDRKIEVNPQFLEDLKTADIQLNDYRSYSDDILILHGTDDEVVPFDAVSSFCAGNTIDFVPVEGADHRFQKPDCMNYAISRMLEFFGM